MRSTSRRAALAAAGVTALSAAWAAAAIAAPGASTGPSTETAPYLLRSQPGVVTKSILTVGDSVDGYRMVGLPDGLGAFDNGDGTFTLLSNHELASDRGVTRAHGAAGAFVSRWTIDKDTLRVTKGEDLIRDVSVASGTTTLNRLCSATFAPLSAFYDASTGTGYDGRLFTDGEETGGGRAFAHALDGSSWELPRLGRLAYENAAPDAGTGSRTIVASTDDTTPGQVYVYKGTKQSSGSPVDRAGLTNGELYGIKVPGLPQETVGGDTQPREKRLVTAPENDAITNGLPFTLAPLGDVSSKSGAQLDSDSNAAGVTRFLRPEDVQWDPRDPHVLYFVTTDRFAKDGQPARSRLWQARFDDDFAGGTIRALLDGTEGQQMMDNITVDRRGRVLIQEDPGEQAYRAKVWLYSPASDRLYEVARFDAARFTPGEPGFITDDEESSGIIDASELLGDGWYLLDAQVHRSLADPELVEMGQYVALHVPAGKFS